MHAVGRPPARLACATLPAASFLLAMVLSPAWSAAAPAGEPAGDAVYLLITNQTLAAAFQPLVERRSAQGKTGKILTVEWICANYDGTRPDRGTDDQTRIRNCIIDHYPAPRHRLGMSGRR